MSQRLVMWKTTCKSCNVTLAQTTSSWIKIGMETTSKVGSTTKQGNHLRFNQSYLHLYSPLQRHVMPGLLREALDSTNIGGLMTVYLQLRRKILQKTAYLARWRIILHKKWNRTCLKHRLKASIIKEPFKHIDRGDRFCKPQINLWIQVINLISTQSASRILQQLRKR